MLSEQVKRNVRGYIDGWRTNPHQIFSDAAIEHLAEMLKPPLQYPFPREAVEQQVLRLIADILMGVARMHLGERSGYTQAEIKALAKVQVEIFEQLCSGVSENPEPFDEDQSMSPLNAGEISTLQGKPVCATCKGSGEVPKCCLHTACSESDQFKPCPACKPYTGGARCRRCGNVPGDSLIICPAGPGDHRYVDERVKQQRQMEKDRRAPLMERRCDPKTGRHWTNRSGDRRIGDRRAKGD